MRTQLFIFGIILILSAPSCVDNQTVDELIAREVDKKIEQFKKKKMRECQEYIYMEAESHVDSIMYLEIGNSMNDSLKLPERPERPEENTDYQIRIDTFSAFEKWKKDTFQTDSTFHIDQDEFKK